MVRRFGRIHIGIGVRRDRIGGI